MISGAIEVGGIKFIGKQRAVRTRPYLEKIHVGFIIGKKKCWRKKSTGGKNHLAADPLGEGHEILFLCAELGEGPGEEGEVGHQVLSTNELG